MNSLFRNSIVAAAAALTLFGVGATAAQAQDDDTMRVDKPFRVKVGGFFPTDGDLKDVVGDNFITAGVAYDFLKTRSTNPTIFSGYFDYVFEKEKTIGSVKNKLGIWGLGVSARFLFVPPTERTGSPYAELGLGYYNVDAKSSGVVNGVSFNDDNSEGKFGGKVAIGYQLPVGLFGEFEYNFISKIEDVNPSGFKASIGYRF